MGPAGYFMASRSQFTLRVAEGTLVLPVPMASETDTKMPFFLEFLPKKNDTDKKKINGTPNGWMGPDCIPGYFHFPAPVNIIKDQYRVIVYVG